MMSERIEVPDSRSASSMTVLCLKANDVEKPCKTRIHHAPVLWNSKDFFVCRTGSLGSSTM